MNKIWSYISILLIISGCSISQSAIESDYTYLYDEEQKLLKPAFKVYHDSEDSSTLYFTINSNDLLFKKTQSDTTAALVGFKYKLKSSRNEKDILDSATVQFYDFGKNNESKLLQGHVKIACPYGEVYTLEIRVRDEFKDFNVVHYIDVDKRENGNIQFFQFVSQNRVICEPYIPKESAVNFVKSPLIKHQKFIIESSIQERRKASPPFAMAKVNERIFYPSSSDTLNFESDTILLLFQNELNRFYPLGKAEYSNYVLSYKGSYPDIVKVEDLLFPLRYISTTNEFNKLTESELPRKEFENFWMQFARDQNHAKRMIAEFYQRVETTNQFFTSHKEGWKTDRGIIYVVYGQPSKVEKNNNQESWIYGEVDNILSVRFNFVKEKSNWSNNDYVLNRDPLYKTNWYRAVDAWRQGKIIK